MLQGYYTVSPYTYLLGYYTVIYFYYKDITTVTLT